MQFRRWWKLAMVAFVGATFVSRAMAQQPPAGPPSSGKVPNAPTSAPPLPMVGSYPVPQEPSVPPMPKRAVGGAKAPLFPPLSQPTTTGSPTGATPPSVPLGGGGPDSPSVNPPIGPMPPSMGSGIAPGMSAPGMSAPAAAKNVREMSLDELLQNAVRNHGEILAAQARSREAEAEAYRIRQKVLGQIAVMKLDYEASVAVYKESSERLSSVESLYKSKAISMEEVRAAQLVKLKAKAEMAKAESNLASSAGVIPPEARHWLNLTAAPPAPGSVQVWAGSYDPMVRPPTPTGPWQSPGVPPGMATYGIVGSTTANPSAVKSNLPHEKLIAILEKTLKLEVEGPIHDVLEIVRPHFDPIEVIGMGELATENKSFRTRNPITLAAAVQWIEDEYRVRFVYREYGVVVVDEKKSLPPGALTVTEIWQRHRQASEVKARP